MFLNSGKRVALMTLAVLAAATAACTIHFPYDYYEDRGMFRVTFRVDPDDAEVLLNGRVLGLAYEFADRDSCLVLSSKSNELVLRKRGYEEVEVNLFDYPGRDIQVQFKMKPGRDYGTKPEAAEKEKEAKAEAKSETVQTPPPEKAPEKAPVVVTVVNLTVNPSDAAIYINGKFWGIAPEDGKITNLRLPPGKVLLDVTKPGYKAYSKEIEIPKQGKFELQIKLEK